MVFLFACSSKKENNQAVDTSSSTGMVNIQESDLLVYGSMTCPHCVAFITKLESKGIPFTFYDVEKSDTRWKEMYEKVKSINYQGYVSFPIVDAKGSIFVNPTYEEVMKSLTKGNR